MLFRDTISYAGNVILTIYHKGFNEKMGHHNLTKTEKIGRFNLTFKEEVVDDNFIENINGWNYKLEGFLDSKDIRNPYREAACTHMVQYVYLNKPKRLFNYDGDRYQLNISDKLFKSITLFTKKYTGLNLQRQAMCFGNVFVYECYQRNYHAENDKGIVIDNVSKDTKIIVNFKYDNIVVYTKMITVEDDKRKTEVLSDCEWNSFDIQIYANNKLTYFDQNISIMSNMILNSSITGQSRRISLNKLGEDVYIERKGRVSTNIIGKKPNEIKRIITESNNSIQARLDEKNDENFVFISPNELEKSKDYIIGILRLECDEIWIFDPYFSDRNGKTISLDWLKILAYCNANKKNIAFWNNESKDPVTVKEFERALLADRVIKDAIGSKKKLGIHLYQINTYIHDRFIFSIDKNQTVTGITIGTSLNSLDSNYYCINKLSSVSARNVFNELKQLMDDSNIKEKISI
ncbi:hypothetical protein [Siminovitchia fordii]|uniref:Uncharacterized protein n=1 Tax=Siminovitchia fordii TaxID=254759 RepID=A0ABQ4KCD4_9BACI|nr:hypothetical protein [Siminovitchia fordii]GIN23386.1 hypothetical protein J1TS3_45200 [Siminovitchia fordii]